ncbi:uncharacterized protein LOC111643806 [Copidosoma floridanum]|uniref:uncharacterized protein LOC111643806 n=1 Tax=Copidosoma floridanum TaxID=29053 RepID=UPI000C6F9329|nr:uncharacterized protein LOC111643806 [Copidosoma floridanum]
MNGAIDTNKLNKLLQSKGDVDCLIAEVEDEMSHALIAGLIKDPANYKEAVASSDRDKWLRAIDEELESMRKNQVWKLVERPTVNAEGGKPNIIDSRKNREESEDARECSTTVTRENVPYREAVGSLLYLANTIRPDISYSVNVLSRHQIGPTEDDWKMVKRVFRYLQHTRTLGLIYRGCKDGLEAYSDASLADCKGSITTGGYLLRLYGDTVAWKTRKQNYVAISTCEAEYVAMCNASQELIGLEPSISIILSCTLLPADLRSSESTTMSDPEVHALHIIG